VVLKPCFELNDEALTDLRRFLFARMAGYAVPKSFNVAVSIPRTASGKILR
jgi:acyl-coenzyme A synthetase/AMP-(fatty) acid ligase